MAKKAAAACLDEQLMSAIASLDVESVNAAINSGADPLCRRKRDSVPVGTMVTPALFAGRLFEISRGNRDAVRKFPPRVLQYLCDAYDASIKRIGKLATNQAAKQINSIVVPTDSRPSFDDILQAMQSGDTKRYKLLMKAYKKPRLS